MWWLHIVNVCFISLFFDGENTDHTLQLTLGLTTIKIKEMFWLLQIIIIIIINEFHERGAYFLLKYLVRVGVVNSRLRVFFPFLVCLFWQGTISEQGQLSTYVKNLRASFHHLPTKPPALVFSEARRLSWPKLNIFTPFDTAMFALPDRPYFMIRTRPFMIRIWDHCLQ